MRIRALISVALLSVPTAALTDEPTALQQIMQDLSDNLIEISDGLLNHDLELTAKGAMAIAEHPPIPPEQVQLVAKELGPEMPVFKQFDVSVHNLAVEINARHSLIAIYKTQAELHLAMARVPASLDCAERAIHLAEELDVESGQGASFRVWGRALSADGQQQKALAKFDQSLSLLEHDPYERAQTQMYYGLALASNGDESRGTALIEKARQAFQQLQAEFDLAELEALTAGVQD